ncbi:FHA domain-containing protein [Streptomyces sp. JJ36]|uniref:FHA domain-containing protein n=1 Tax=Streptomyces sp. JJ36 TaxID=2736645 RepID=UPI001F2BA775|nr:FHA domain-containing protein [Streptomyces sp. JJ36]MCF6526237.1 FHA domain-containing protein [Streptomyces sp. JJ36]
MTSPDSRTRPSPPVRTENAAEGPAARPDAAAADAVRRPAAPEAHLTVLRRVVTAPVPRWPEAPRDADPSREAAPAEVPGPAAGSTGLRVRMRRAWRLVRSPELLLPAPGPHPFSIGRAPGSMLRLSHYTVSRAHAQLRSTGQGWTLRDLGSANGTWVNGRRITGSVTVRAGDHVRFGQVGFRLAAS